MNRKAAASKSERHHARENAFLLAAEELFAQAGYTQTSMEQIAERAKTATGTIYLYFSSKEHLYAELLNRKLRECRRLLEQRLDDASSSEERLSILLATKIEFFQRNQAFLRLYVSELGQRAPVRSCIPPACETTYLALKNVLVRVFERGVAEGEFQPHPPEVLASAFIGLTNQVLIDFLASPSKKEVPIQRCLLDILQRGFLRKPRLARRSRPRHHTLLKNP
ncbi:MAG: TetR/AcrR family transcriptional regulator [Verrucomicrobiia bacterium]